MTPVDVEVQSGGVVMRHLISTIAAVALASAVGVFAQEQQAPAQGPASSNEQAQKSTVTGCVVQAKTTAGDTVFVLSKAEGGSAPMYVLGGATPAEWSGHVNKKVEVIGPVQEPPPPSADKEGAPDPKVVRPPLIIVESVKVVAENCS
jgi:hypothetical protein